MNVLKMIYGSTYADIPENDHDAFSYMIGQNVEESEIREKIKTIINLDYLTDSDISITSDQLKKLTKEEVFNSRIVPVSVVGGVLHFAIDGVVNPKFRDLAKKFSSVLGISNHAITYVAFEEGFDRVVDMLFVDGVVIKELETAKNERKELLTSSLEKRGPVYADYILNKGFDLRASDIHIENYDNGIQVRYRVDGQLNVTDFYSKEEIPAYMLINAVKFRAKLDSGERRKGQDGGIKDVEHKGNVYDVRASSISTVLGEKIVLRILEKSTNIPTLTELGFSKFYVDSILNDVQKSHGLVLYTGSVGSGKSTTQRTLLVNSSPRTKNVYSIEDPVERTIPFVNHICVKETNVDFDGHLETLLRQDPDIIAIGEIRNKKTMNMALKASLSGQLVFATLHTNSAIEAFYRLFNMGIEPYELGAALIGISSQRLIRKLCPYCSEKHKTTAAEKDLIMGLLSNFSRFSNTKTNKFDYISVPKGCSHCNSTGFSGRTVVGEYLSASDDIKHYVSSGDVDRLTLLEMADDTFVPIEVDALNKVLLGKTSLSEVLRVI